MNSEKIVASDMSEALRVIKERYGPDAFILESKTLRGREPGSLIPRSQVELTVSMQAPPPSSREFPVMAGYDGTGGLAEGKSSVSEELTRLESMLAQLETLETHLADSSREGYPLDGQLRDYGISQVRIRELARDFEEEVPLVDQKDPEVALHRLGACLPCAKKMKVDGIRGVHVLMGPPGVGKTSLALKIAGRVSEAGASVVILAYGPRNTGEVRRLEEAARSLNFEVALAQDPQTLLGALRHLSLRDLILVDMPPLAEEHWELLSNAERTLHGEPLIRHLVLPADGGWRRMAEIARRVDFLALTRTDLDDALRPALDLLGRGSTALAFLSAGAEPESPLELARASQLLSPLTEILERSRAASPGSVS